VLLYFEKMETIKVPDLQKNPNFTSGRYFKKEQLSIWGEVQVPNGF
jgi:hypothetical protein